MPSLAKALNLGGVNCYLLSSGSGYILVDTGYIGKRKQLEEGLAAAGCAPGNLKLILVTHGDSDHADNCAYLHGKFGCPVAMHALDAEMVQLGDMSRNRKPKADRYSLLFKMMGKVFGSFASRRGFETFTPDIQVDEEFDLRKYGLPARIVHMPGHSKGSIGVLTDDGELFCGDFAYNMPGFQFIDDMADHLASLAKLKEMKIQTVYPGHGRPFSKATLIRKG